MEGTRLTIQAKPHRGFDFTIRTPGTPARYARAWVLATVSTVMYLVTGVGCGVRGRVVGAFLCERVCAGGVTLRWLTLVLTAIRSPGLMCRLRRWVQMEDDLKLFWSMLSEEAKKPLDVRSPRKYAVLHRSR